MDTQRTHTRTASPKASDAERKDALIAKWLRICAEINPMYARYVTAEKLDIYCELLGDLEMADLARGLELAAKRHPEFPTPAAIRRYAEEDPPAPPAADWKPDDCDFCYGSGWETTADGAVRCRCRKPGYVKPQPKPRTQLTAAETAAIEKVIR